MSPIITLTRPVRLILFAISLFLLSVVMLPLLTAPSAVRAQEPMAVGRPTKEAQELLEELDDIDTLSSLTPLKFTPDQIDKLIAAINSAKTDYDHNVTTLASAPVTKMADEIRATRKQALAGKPSPPEFTAKIQKLQSDFMAKRTELNNQNILRMSGETSKILTSSQRATVVKMEKDYLKKVNRYSDQTSEGQLYNAFVVDLFINNARIVPLLKDLKAATESKDM